MVFVAAGVRGVADGAYLPVDVLCRGGPGVALVDGSSGLGGEMKVAGGEAAEPGGCDGLDVAGEFRGRGVVAAEDRVVDEVVAALLAARTARSSSAMVVTVVVLPRVRVSGSP
jgi:hypothetical protein